MRVRQLLLATLFLLCSCGGGVPQTQQATANSSHQTGTVTLTFTLPASAPSASAAARHAMYVSPATTKIAVAMKSINGAAAPANTQIFRTADICNRGTCSATLTLQVGDDVVGVLAYTDALASTPGNVPLSFAEGEVFVGGGSQSWSGDPIDQTGHLYISLFPVIGGGQVTLSSDANRKKQCGCVPLNLGEFVDGANEVIPAQAYASLPPPYFANTPYLVDSDSSNLTYLKDETTGAHGASIAISSPSDTVDFVNTQKEASGQTITATVSFRAASSDATFTIPSYFGINGSLSARQTIPPPGSSSPLTFHCSAASAVC